jgi:hypothetical protein
MPTLLHDAPLPGPFHPVLPVLPVLPVSPAGDGRHHPRLDRPARGWRRAATVIAATGAIGAAVIVVSPARAAAVPGGCSASGGTVSCPFAFTDGEQLFTVPDGVRQLHVELVGARGFGPNAYGGKIAADLAVTPGQVLFVEVGGQGGAPGLSPSLGGTGGAAGGGATGGTGGEGGATGGTGGPADGSGTGGTGGTGGDGGAAGGGSSAGGAGGFNGGGAGSAGGVLGGGGGGGASDIRTCSSSGAGCDSLGSRLVVAGGGGGIGGNSVGGSGGDPDGHDALRYGPNSFFGGYGASQTAPGLTTPPPTPFNIPDEWGALGRGGEGLDVHSTAPDGLVSYPDFGAGGGGGGLYGGSGGWPGVAVNGTPSSVTGGGGGSSWGPAGSVYAPGTSSDPASVTISYTPDAAAPTVQITAPADGATYAQGDSVTADYACSDGPDGSGVASCDGTAPAGSAIDTASAGEHTFTVDAVDEAGNRASATVHYTVRAPDAPSSPSSPSSLGTGTPSGAAPPPAGGTPTGSSGQPGTGSPSASAGQPGTVSPSQPRRGAASMGAITHEGNHPAAGGSPDRAGADPTPVPRAFGLRLTAKRVRLRLTGSAVVVVAIDRRSGHRWQRVRHMAARSRHAGALTLPIRHLAAGRYRLTVHVRVGRRSHTRRVFAVLPGSRRRHAHRARG